MRFRDGTVRQKALFATLVGVYVLGLAIALADIVGRVGQPVVGWVIDGRDIFPMRADAAAAGLFGGGRAGRAEPAEADPFEERRRETARRAERPRDEPGECPAPTVPQG